MKYSITGRTVPPTLPYGRAINDAAVAGDYWPMALYATAYVERISSEFNGFLRNFYGDGVTAATCVDSTGGYGLFALTSKFVDPWPPADWMSPKASAKYAIDVFLQPAVDFWYGEQKFEGDALLRCVFAEFNAGRGGALSGHKRGNVDLYTQGGDYAARSFDAFSRLRLGETLGLPSVVQ